MSSVDRFHSIGTLNRDSADATSQTSVSEWKICKLNGMEYIEDRLYIIYIAFLDYELVIW